MIDGAIRRGVGLILAFAVAAAGCSGGSAATSAVGLAFADQARAVCQVALDSKRAWKPLPLASFDPTKPDPAQLAPVATWLHDEVAPTFDQWDRGLLALGTPPTGQTEWSRLLASVAKVKQGDDSQVAAALAGDPAAFADATAALKASQPELVAAAAAAGLAVCAEVHAG